MNLTSKQKLERLEKMEVFLGSSIGNIINNHHTKIGNNFIDYTGIFFKFLKYHFKIKVKLSKFDFTVGRKQNEKAFYEYDNSSDIKGTDVFLEFLDKEIEKYTVKLCMDALLSMKMEKDKLKEDVFKDFVEKQK